MVFIDHVLGTYFRPESDVLTLVGVPCQVWDVDPDTMPTGLPPHAPAVGTCMAELIAEGRARTVDVEPLRLGRFAEGKRVEGRHPYQPRRDHQEPSPAGGPRRP